MALQPAVPDRDEFHDQPAADVPKRQHPRPQSGVLAVRARKTAQRR
jgi:hypothetical protein